MGSAWLRRTRWIGTALLVVTLPLSITSCSDSGSDTPSADTLAQAEQLTFDEMHERFEVVRAVRGGLPNPGIPKNVTEMSEFMCRDRYDQETDQSSAVYGVHQVTEVSDIEAQSENLVTATVQYTQSDESGIQTHRSQFQLTDDGTWISCSILDDGKR